MHVSVSALRTMRDGSISKEKRRKRRGREREREREREKRKKKHTRQHARHALLAASAQAKQRGAAHADATRAQTQGLDDIGAALDAAVDPDFDAVKHLGAVLADFQEGVDGRGRRVEGAAAVVGQDDGSDVGGVQRGEVGVFVGLDALEHNRLACVPCEPGQRGAPG